MTCRDLAELLIDYVAGDLPTDQAQRIRTHLDACPKCVCYIETYQLTIRLTRQLRPVSPPLALLERLRAAAAQEEERPD
jgi:anti-sigma factor RsiW